MDLNKRDVLVNLTLPMNLMRMVNTLKKCNTFKLLVESIGGYGV